MNHRCLIWILLAACTGDGSGGIDAAGNHGDGPRGDGPGPAIDAAIDAAPGVGEPPELVGITLYHNQVRAMVQTTTPLPALQWEPALAATAAAWIAQCQNTDGSPNILDHNPNRSQGHPYYVGENIFAASGTATAQAAVDAWASEKPNYNPTTGACSGVCGHYTQMVWRTTLKVGCARGNCPSITYPNSIVCDYGPGGNYPGPAY